MFCFDNHLSKQMLTRIDSVLFPYLPYQILGFSLVGFTAFHFIISNKLRHCGTFRVLTMVTFRLRVPPLCTPTYLALSFPLAQSLRASQLVRAWTFLYECSDCPDRNNLLFNSVRVESMSPQEFLEGINSSD